jgi:hypothetical protein
MADLERKGYADDIEVAVQNAIDLANDVLDTGRGFADGSWSPDDPSARPIFLSTLRSTNEACRQGAAALSRTAAEGEGLAITIGQNKSARSGRMERKGTEEELAGAVDDIAELRAQRTIMDEMIARCVDLGDVFGPSIRFRLQDAQKQCDALIADHEDFLRSYGRMSDPRPLTQKSTAGAHALYRGR